MPETRSILRNKCKDILAKWRNWIKTVVVIVYCVFILILLPKLIIRSFNRKKSNDTTVFIGGFFSLLTIPISLVEIVQHMIHYSCPPLQLHIIRILWMVPIYSLNAIPKSKDGWKWIAHDFEEQWNFPHCVGSVDGKHVSIQKPRNSGSYYFNYKGTFSIVLMAIVDANYQFMMIDVGANGRVSDGGLMKNTVFWRKLSDNQLNILEPHELPHTETKLPYVFVADEAFQLFPNFMKPYNRAVLSEEKRIFNYRLSRARRIVENVFGILTKRFKVLGNTIKFEPDTVRKIVMACCHLHNYLCSKNKTNYLHSNDIDSENTSTGEVEPGSWRQNAQQLTPLQRTKGNSTVEAKKIRDEFCTYFNTYGSVPWQNKCLNN